MSINRWQAITPDLESPWMVVLTTGDVSASGLSMCEAWADVVESLLEGNPLRPDDRIKFRLWREEDTPDPGVPTVFLELRYEGNNGEVIWRYPEQEHDDWEALEEDGVSHTFTSAVADMLESGLYLDEDWTGVLVGIETDRRASHVSKR